MPLGWFMLKLGAFSQILLHFRPTFAISNCPQAVSAYHHQTKMVRKLRNFEGRDPMKENKYAEGLGIDHWD